jgi:predicted transport protein
VIRLVDWLEEDYLDGKYDAPPLPDQTRNLFYRLKNRILETFPDLENKQKKQYSGFYSKKDGSAICTIEARKTKLILSYSTTKKGIVPVDSFVQDYAGKGKWGIGNYQSFILNEDDITKAIPLIAKVYESKN